MAETLGKLHLKTNTVHCRKYAKYTLKAGVQVKKGTDETTMATSFGEK